MSAVDAAGKRKCQVPSVIPFAAGRVVELAIVEPQISLQEQSSLTPASGVYRWPLQPRQPCMTGSALVSCVRAVANRAMPVIIACIQSSYGKDMMQP